MKKELTKKQIEQQDFIDNVIFEMICELSPKGEDEEWNIELIAEIRELLIDYFKEKYSDFNENEFYPSIED